MAMKTRVFKVIPMFGKVIKRGEQKYRLEGSQYKTRQSDGEEYVCLTWSSHCAVCDAVFETTSTLTVKYLNRRCKKHRKPGIPASAKSTKPKTTKAQKSKGSHSHG